MRSIIATIFVSAALILPSQAIAGDIEAGEKVFKKCSACHNAAEAKNKIGPHLVGIIDREAGTVEGFKYSKALMAQAEDGLIWTPENIGEYLAKPTTFMKGTKMSFAGLKKQEDIDNVIAYLAAQNSN